MIGTGWHVRITAPHPSAGVEGVVVQHSHQTVVIHQVRPGRDPLIYHVYQGYVQVLTSAVDLLGELAEEKGERA